MATVRAARRDIEGVACVQVRQESQRDLRSRLPKYRTMMMAVATNNDDKENDVKVGVDEEGVWLLWRRW
jgi:hypothetical protein